MFDCFFLIATSRLIVVDYRLNNGRGSTSPLSIALCSAIRHKNLQGAQCLQSVGRIGDVHCTVCGCHGITNNNNIGTSVVAIVSWLTNER